MIVSRGTILVRAQSSPSAAAGQLASRFARFFLYILGGFSVLVLIITVFQLLDYIARNNIEWLVVANYLAFLLPTIVNSVAPLAALVAVMVTFAILQKTSQVVALKASGQSIYRMAVPALVGSILLSAVSSESDYTMRSPIGGKTTARLDPGGQNRRRHFTRP
jgi:hypothetical protein